VRTELDFAVLEDRTGFATFDANSQLVSAAQIFGSACVCNKLPGLPELSYCINMQLMEKSAVRSISWRCWREPFFAALGWLMQHRLSP